MVQAMVDEGKLMMMSNEIDRPQAGPSLSKVQKVDSLGDNTIKKKVVGKKMKKQENAEKGRSHVVAGSGGSGEVAAMKRSSPGKAVILGSEIEGRKIELWNDSESAWLDAKVVTYDAGRRKHCIRFLEKGSVEGQEREKWLNLLRNKFRWIDVPAPTAAPNPTFAEAPGPRELIDKKIKVFWPHLSKWYVGKVVAFDEKSGKHTVKYKDGEEKVVDLRHEVVIYNNISAAMAKRDADPNRKVSDDDAGNKKGRLSLSGKKANKKGDETEGKKQDILQDDKEKNKGKRGRPMGSKGKTSKKSKTCDPESNGIAKQKKGEGRQDGGKEKKTPNSARGRLVKSPEPSPRGMSMMQRDELVIGARVSVFRPKEENYFRVCVTLCFLWFL